MSSEKHCVRCGAGSASRRGNICMACGEEAPANEDDGAGRDSSISYAELMSKAAMDRYSIAGGGGGPDCGVAIIQWPRTGGGDLSDAVREFVKMVPAIDTAEAPPPYALTAAQLPGLERAIRAEGYSVLVDTESGEVLLMKPTEDKRLRAPVGRMEQALRAILSRIQFGGEPYPGLIEQLCKEGLGE